MFDSVLSADWCNHTSITPKPLPLSHSVSCCMFLSVFTIVFSVSALSGARICRVILQSSSFPCVLLNLFRNPTCLKEREQMGMQRMSLRGDLHGYRQNQVLRRLNPNQRGQLRKTKLSMPRRRTKRPR